MILITTLLTMSRNQLFVSQQSLAQQQALYAAEAGLAIAMAELEKDPTWVAGFSDQPLPSGNFSFSLSFASDPSTATSRESINNLGGLASVASYHGPGTLPARNALLIVTGRSGLAQRTIEAQVVYGSRLPKDLAISSTGKIELDGNIKIGGHPTLYDPSGVAVDLHTNSSAPGVLVSYTNSGPNPSASLEVSGTIRSGGSPGSVVLSGTNTVGGVEEGVPPRLLSKRNSDAVLADSVGLPSPAIPTAPGPLTVSGERYYPGDVTINGDLVLEGNAKIHVAGALKINGSVRGTGALIVWGKTELYGDSRVSANSEDYVAVLTKSHLIVKGFDGQAYLDSLAASDPLAAEHLEDLRWGLQKIESLIEAQGTADPASLSSFFNLNDIEFDTVQNIITEHENGTALGQTVFTGTRNRHTNSSGYLKSLIGPGTTGSTEAFLSAKMDMIDDLFRDTRYDRNNNHATNGTFQVLDDFSTWDPFTSGGLFDSVQSANSASTPTRIETQRRVLGMINQLDFDRIGSAEFKGFVYAEGAVVVKSDVNIEGALVVNGNPGVGTLTDGGKVYHPGDLSLQGNCGVTFVEELFDRGVLILEGSGTLDIKRWVNR